MCCWREIEMGPKHTAFGIVFDVRGIFAHKPFNDHTELAALLRLLLRVLLSLSFRNTRHGTLYTVHFVIMRFHLFDG